MASDADTAALIQSASRAAHELETAGEFKRPLAGHMPRHELKALAAGMGADEAASERVAEAAIRRAQAAEEGRMFIYVDIEYELEDLYRANGSTESIGAAKQKVWDAARAISERRGLPIEEALFFCFHEAADAFRASQAAEAA
jgi:hypothetical protein